MRKSESPTVFTFLSILLIVTLVYLGYRVRGVYSSDLVVIGLGVPIVLIFLVIKIGNYCKKLQNEKINQILKALPKLDKDQELKSELMRIFLEEKRGS